MPTIGETTRPGFVYDSATDTWIPVGIGPHSHTPAAIGAISSSVVTTKGDLIVATGSGTVVRQGVGADGSYLVADSTQADGVLWAGPSNIAGKNVLINGGFDIWQRGTSFSQVTGYSADRWYINASTTTTITRDTTVLTPNSQYSLKATATGTQQIFLQQAIETANVVNLAGKTVVLSAYVAGSTGTSTNINLSLAFSTSTDNAVTGTWTDITPVSAGNITTTTAMQRVSAVFSVPSNAKSLRVLLVNNAANITVGQALFFGDVQLELGSVATVFSRAGGSIGGELALCQRYYLRPQNTDSYANYAIGTARSTTVADLMQSLPVAMRVRPTAVDYFNLQVTFAGISGAAVTNLIIDAASSNQFVTFQATVASGLTQFRPYFLGNNNNAAGYLGLSAEL
jgi:hypothetical protein